MNKNYQNKKIKIEVPLAMMGNLDGKIIVDTYWAPEEIEELGIDKIEEPAIGSFGAITKWGIEKYI